MDQKELRKKLEQTVNPVVDQQLEGKAPPAAKPVSSEARQYKPIAGAFKTNLSPEPVQPAETPAAVAPSAPAAGAPTQNKDKVVGIIGTAGRRDAANKAPALTKEIFDGWVERASRMIPADATVVSGGAAWADHVAVRLYLDGKVKGLILELPADLGPGGAFGKYDYVFGTGGYSTPSQKAAYTANKLHEIFSDALGVDTRAEIQQAIEKGAMDGTVTVRAEPADSDDPFKNRNTKVAQLAKDGLLAFTPVGKDGGPVDGGTRDTWEKHSKIYPDGKRVAPKDPGIDKAFEGMQLREYRAPRAQAAEAAMPSDMPELEYDAPTEIPGEILPESATSPAEAQGVVDTPPQGETPVSVAPRAISGESTSGRRGRVILTDNIAEAAKVGSKAIWGDNVEKKGFGGAAKDGRKLFKDWGIATKRSPSMNEGSFFEPGNEADKAAMVADIDRVLAMAETELAAGRDVYIQRGIGTGLSDLKTKAPDLFKILGQRLREFYVKNQTTEDGQRVSSVEGYNIVSSSRNKGRGYPPELQRDLDKITNATFGRLPLTKDEVAAALGFEPKPPKGYANRPYQDIESWYHGNKTGDKQADEAMLQKLVEAKFRKYPEVIEIIDRLGGVQFLEASTHDGTGKPDWEGKGSASKTIRMWISAYKKVKGGAAPEKITTAATPDNEMDAAIAAAEGIGETAEAEAPAGRRTDVSAETVRRVQAQASKEDTRPSVLRAKQRQERARIIDFLSQPHAGADRIYDLYVSRVAGDTESVGRLRALDSASDPVARNRGRQAVRSDFLHEMMNYLNATTPRVEAEREAFREILRTMGMLPEAERIGFETKIGSYKDPFGPPSFSAKGSKVTPELAEKNNTQRDQLAAEQVAEILRKLHRSGRLGVLNHPDFVQFTKWAFDTISEYDKELTEGIRAEFNPTRERSFVSQITKLDEKDIDIRDEEKLREILSEISGSETTAEGEDVLRGEFYDDLRRAISVPGMEDNPRTRGVVVSLADAIAYRTRGQRRYALDRIGLIDERWQQVDALGLDVPVFSNVHHPTGASAAAISFNLSTDLTAGVSGSATRNIGAEIDATRALKKHLKRKLTNYADLPGTFGTWGARTAEEAAALASGEASKSELGLMVSDSDNSPTIKLNRTIPYTVDFDQVESIRQRIMSELPQDKLVMIAINKGVRMQGAIVLRDGSTFDVSERFIIMDESDPRIVEVLSKLGKEGSVSRPFVLGETVEYPRGAVASEEFQSIRFEVDPVVYPAVRHSIPLRTPPSKQYPFGWAPRGVYYPANFEGAGDYEIVSGETVRSFDRSLPADDPDVISTMIMPTGQANDTYPKIGQYIDGYQFGNLIDEDPQLYAEIGRPELGEARAGEITSGFRTMRQIQEEEAAGVPRQDATKLDIEGEGEASLLEESLMRTQGMRQPIRPDQNQIITTRPNPALPSEEIGGEERRAAVRSMVDAGRQQVPGDMTVLERMQEQAAGSRGNIGKDISKNMQPIFAQNIGPVDRSELGLGRAMHGDYDGSDLYDELEKDRVYKEARQYAEEGMRLDEAATQRPVDIEQALPTEIIEPTPEEISDIAKLQSRLLFMIRRRAVKSIMLTATGENIGPDQVRANQDVSGIKATSDLTRRMYKFLVENGIEVAEQDSLIRKDVIPAFGYEGPDRRYWVPKLTTYSPKELVSSEGRYSGKRKIEITAAPGDEAVAKAAQELYEFLAGLDRRSRLSDAPPISFEAYVSQSAAKAAEIGVAAQDIGAESPDVAESSLDVLTGGIGNLTDRGSRLALEMEKYVAENVDDPREKALIVEMLRLGPKAFDTTAIGLSGGNMSYPAYPDEWKEAKKSDAVRGSGSEEELKLQRSWEAYIDFRDRSDHPLPPEDYLNNLMRKFGQENIGRLSLPDDVRGRVIVEKPARKFDTSKLAALSKEDRRAAIEMALETHARHIAADMDGDGWLSTIRNIINLDKITSTIAHSFNESGQIMVDEKMFGDKNGVLRKPVKRGTGLRSISVPELVQLFADTPYVLEADIMLEIMQDNRLTLVFDQDKGVYFLAKADVDPKTGRVRKIDFDARIKLREKSENVSREEINLAIAQYGGQATMNLSEDGAGTPRVEGGKVLLGVAQQLDRQYLLDISPGMMEKFAPILGTNRNFVTRTDSIKERVLAYVIDVAFRSSQLAKVNWFLSSSGVEMPYEKTELSPEGQADKVIELIKLQQEGEDIGPGRGMKVTGPLGKMTAKTGEYYGDDAIKQLRIRRVREEYTRKIDLLSESLKRNGELIGKESNEYKRIVAEIAMLQEEARQKITDIMAEPVSEERVTPRGITAIGREADSVELTQPFVDPMLDDAIAKGHSIDLNTVPTKDGRRLPVRYRVTDEQRTNYTKSDIALIRRIRALQRQGNLGKMTLGAGAAGIGLGLAANAITNRIQFGEEGDEITQANLAPAVALEAIGAVNNTAGAVANLGWVAMNRGDMLRALVNLFGSIGGGIIGGAAGALTGNPFVAGGGAFVGSNAGALATDTLYSAITGNNGLQQMAPNVAVQVPNNAQLTELNSQIDKPQKDMFDIYGERT